MKIIVLILISFSLSASGPKFIDELSQMSSKNKAQHYWVSNIGTMAVGHFLYIKTGRVALSCLGGAVIMYGIGELKERVYDGYFKNGVNSGGDRFMNGQGCFFGVFQTRVEIDIWQRNNPKKAQEIEFKKHIF